METRLYAHVKRFRELMIGDDRFRAAIVTDAHAAVAAAGLDLDPEPLSFMWAGGSRMGDAPEVHAYQRHDAKGLAYLDFAAADEGAVAPYRSWRERQIARTAFALGSFAARWVLHLPYAVELTRGCSLNCWFCGLSAGRLEGAAPTDLARWERILRNLREVFGASAARGFLFWATDPLDHPDYEAHAEVFRRVLGRFPTTTTAAAHIDPARSRRLIALAHAGGDSLPLRFSVVCESARARWTRCCATRSSRASSRR